MFFRFISILFLSYGILFLLGIGFGTVNSSKLHPASIMKQGYRTGSGEEHL